MTPKEAHDVLYDFGYHHSLVSKLRANEFDDIEIAQIIVAIQSTCHHCWNGDSDCQCWNDE